MALKSIKKLHYFSRQCKFGGLNFILFSFLSLFLSAKTCYSQGIRIIDCNGNTRAIRQQAQQISATQSQVQIEVIDASGQLANGGEFKLFNAKGDILKAVAQNGIAKFPVVDSGVWMLGSDTPGFFYSSISLSDPIIPAFWDSAGEFLSQAGNIILVTGAVVGAAVVVDHTTNGGGGGSTPPSMGCPTCDPDEVAPSIPPFQ